MTFCLINVLRSLGPVAVDFGADVFVERSARTIRNKKKMNLCNNSPSIRNSGRILGEDWFVRYDERVRDEIDVLLVDVSEDCSYLVLAERRVQ